MAVVKVIELLGESEKSWEDATQQVVAEATRTPHSSPHFALASFGMNTPAFDTASAKFCISGASLCSGMLGMRS